MNALDMLDRIQQLPLREQRDILLTTVRNLVEWVDNLGGAVTTSDTIEEFLDAASDGKLR